MVHELKILPEYFKEVWEEKKNFELRKDDRDYKVGDVLLLRELDNGFYTGHEIVVTIKYILRDVPRYGLKEGYCILSFN